MKKNFEIYLLPKNELLSITKCYIGDLFRCSDSKRFAELSNDVPDYNNNDNDDDKLQGGLILRIIYLLKKCRITNVRVNTRIGAWKVKQGCKCISSTKH
jgi:hypothetical protein